jgi:hypothetical protein
MGPDISTASEVSLEGKDPQCSVTILPVSLLLTFTASSLSTRHCASRWSSQERPCPCLRGKGCHGSGRMGFRTPKVPCPYLASLLFPLRMGVGARSGQARCLSASPWHCPVQVTVELPEGKSLLETKRLLTPRSGFFLRCRVESQGGGGFAPAELTDVIHIFAYSQVLL